MQSRLEYIKKILEIYIHRGEVVLRMLEKGESPEKVDDILKWRKASFHNFVALDHQQEAETKNYLNEPQFQKLWEKIQVVDADLQKAIEKEKISLQGKLAKVSKNKRLVSKFHSKSQKGAGFLGSV